MRLFHCGCCGRDVVELEWDGIYTSCNDCAFCASLEHYPCCHGNCKEVAPQVEDH